MVMDLSMVFRFIKQPKVFSVSDIQKAGPKKRYLINKSVINVLFILTLIVSCHSLSSAQDLVITSPANGSCLAGQYTPDSPLEGGIINGNNFEPNPAVINFSYIDDSGNFLDIKVTASNVQPAFKQPDPPLCPDWNFGDDPVAACGGQGYCNFTRSCICFDNNDCDSGNGVCTDEGVCGCGNDAQCGIGQVCNQGQCACADDTGCSAGQACLDGGVCSCDINDDCGEGLICANNTCSSVDEGVSSFAFVDSADPTDPLPRTIEQSIELPADLEDAETLALTVEVIDYNEPSPSIVATETIGFKLDRAFPLLNTADDCSNDGDCAVPGESCDLVTSRCYPDAEANIGTCRPLDDFSQGLSTDYVLNDNYDDNPTLTFLEVTTSGCRELQRMLLTDDCGNSQIVEAEGIRAPNQGEVTVSLEGFVCNSVPCARDQVLLNGEVASRVNVNTIFEAPERCFDYVETILDTLDEDGLVLSSRALFNDEVLQAVPATLLSSREVENTNGSVRIAHGGPFQLTVGDELIFTLANGVTETFTINEEDFFDLDTVPAIEVVIAMNSQTSEVYALLDGNDLRLKTRQLGELVSLDVAGSAAASLGFTVAFDSASAEGSGDGSFRARTDVYACGSEVPLVSDNFNFSVSMPFAISIGGPYIVDEGAELNISAQNIFVSESFGGISKVEWDTDGDGIYEREERFLSPAELLSTRDVNGEVVHSGPFALTHNETLTFTYADGSTESFTVLGQDFADYDEQSGLITATTAEVILSLSRQVSGVIGSSESNGHLLISSVEAGLGVSLTIGGSAAASLGFTSAQSSDFASGLGETISQLLEEPLDDPERAEEMLTVINIDTADQDERLISLKVTTGLGETLETKASVRIDDISPVCVLPQVIYNVREGEVFNFTAPGTVAGGEADPISAYRWSFGDGSTDAENADSSTQHIYEEEGEYTLRLIAIDEDSECPQEATANVIVGGVSPIIDGVGLAPNTLEVIEGEPVEFTSGQTRAGAASDPITEYQWDFGYFADGNSVTLVGPDETAPTHTYEDDGDYNVCLSVSDSDDLVGPNCFLITVQDLNPTSLWNATTLQANEGEAIIFDWTGTVAGGVADPLTGLRWSFSDGSPSVDVDVNTPLINHVFNGDGEFTVRLTAIDEDSETFYEGQVTILDVSPTARFEFVLQDGETNAQEGVALTLDASASTPGADSDPIQNYRWDFGDGSEVQVTNGPTVSHSWPDGPSIYEVQCTAVDSDGSTSTTSLVINVANVDPEVSITGPDAVEVGSEITLNISVDDVVADFPTSPDSGAVVEWDMGDGTILAGASVTHTFGSEGSFNVSVRFFDGDGGEAEANYRVSVTAQLAELSNFNLVVERDQEGGVVEDPQLPINEYSDDEVDEETYYLREGDEITLSILISSARLANGVLNPASFNWQVPEGVSIENTPIAPPAGTDGAGQESTQSVVSWRPNFFAAGEYSVFLSVSGENGGSFNRTWTFKVAERGTPMLATTSGSLRRGRVVFYRYDLVNNTLNFTPNREVNVGRGAYDIIVDDQRQRLFVSSPLSGHVAVLAGDPLSVVRRISTGAGAYDMSWGGGRLWVINTEANTLTAIDPQTLKVERTLDLAGIDRPLALAYVQNDNISPRLIVGCGITGKLLVINAQDMLAGLGESSIEHTIDLGGSITQLAQREGTLWAVDGKFRQIYEGSITTIAQTGNASALNTIEGIPFAASDIAPTAQGLWVATGDQLSLIDPDGFIEGYETSVDRIIEANPILFPSGQNGIVISNGERVEHKLVEANGDLTDSIGLNGSRLQKMANFIQYLE